MPPSLNDRLQTLLGSAFRLDRELTGGGMSRVFVAHEPALKREVVVKVLPPDLVTRESVARFEREVAVTAQLQHPHILPIITTGGADDIYYYVAPYIHGESLRARLAKDGKIPFEETVRLVSELLGAVGFAHARGIIHRDIKPGNILLAEGHAILADFGIARALAGPDDGRLTMTGGAMGTPSYMAPEHPRDEQADLYAVAVVAHEMLTGALPKGRGDISRTTSEIATAVPKGEVSRAKGVAAVLARAMSADTAKRFRTAREFREAIEAAAARSSARRATYALVATAVVLGAVAVWQAVRPPNAATAPSPAGTLLAVFPANKIGSDSLAAGADELAQRLSAAIEGWSDVHVLAPGRVREALGAKPTMTYGDVKAAARKLGVDRAVTGAIGRRGDTVTFTASLQLVDDGSSFRTLVVSFVPGTPSEARELRRLASALFRDGREYPWNDAGSPRRASLAAWVAYDSALVALRTWDTERAVTQLRVSVAGDSMNPRARLLLAHALRWNRRHTPAELTAASHAVVDVSHALGERDSLLAHGVAALARGEWPAACLAYGRAVALDSASFAALFGLGECQQLDPVIIPDRRSTTGLAFRTSWESAARSFQRAIRAAGTTPPAFAFARIATVLPTDRGVLRAGRLLQEQQPAFAYPELSGDSVIYRPSAAPGPPPIPVTRDSALTRNLSVQLQLVGAWAAIPGAGSEAHYRYAELLEQTRGIVSTASLDGATALREIALARRLSHDSVMDAVLMHAHVRLLIKADSFSRAALLADSALRRWRAPDREQASRLIGLAALSGRIERVTQFNRSLSAASSRMIRNPQRDSVGLPASLALARAEYVSRAAFGVCDDRIRTAPSKIAALIEASYAPASRPAWLFHEIVRHPASLAFPCTDSLSLGNAAANDRIVGLQRASLRHDRGEVTRLIAGIDSARRFIPPGALPMQTVMAEATAVLHVGDSASARLRLTRALDAMSNAPRTLLASEVDAAALVRGMALLSELALAAGDVAGAARWADAVVTLWGRADPDLEPFVQRMRRIASRRS